MADFGVRMAFHHHMGTIVETDADVGLLMRHTGEAVGLLYDTGHSIFSGGDPLSLIKAHVKRVVHVHCKDARKPMLERARAEDMSFMGAVMEGIFTVPGDGFIDYPAILRVLADAGYSRLAGGRGRAGSEQGASADLCHDGLQQFVAHGARGGVHDCGLIAGGRAGLPRNQC